MLLRLVALGALAVLAAGCGSGKKETDTSGLPPGCSPADVDTIVTAFLAAPDLAPGNEFDVVGFNESDGRKTLSAHAPGHLRTCEAGRRSASATA